jgi:hypothetical protein
MWRFIQATTLQPLHHGCLMPNKKEKEHPKAMEERTMQKTCKNASASWMPNANGAKKRPPKGNGRNNYSKKPARMPLHHGCLMQKKKKKRDH